MRNLNNTYLQWGGILLAGVFILTPPTLFGATVTRDLKITGVFVDFDNNKVVIKGKDLLFGPGPTVVNLSNLALPVVTANFTKIVAELPPDILDGDYLLTVSRGADERQNDDYDLTIGAVGPQGIQGAQGAPGPQGIQGTQGLPGPQGIQGQQGLQGAQGQRGLRGLQGPMGATGAQGAAGQFDPLPKVVLVPENSHPAIPDGLKVVCYDGPDSPSPSQPSTTCPVVKWAGYTYWAYSYDDNRSSMNIVAYRDVDNSIASQSEKTGARYLYAISVNPATRVITFSGQGGDTVTMTAPEPWLLY
ncbi:MAG: hypothetical protein Q8L68_05445 [Methylococcales bacterium]|nr:hypothetical protein [Methylococcales bacterium]